jgi:hypothetical protein
MSHGVRLGCKALLLLATVYPLRATIIYTDFTSTVPNNGTVIDLENGVASQSVAAAFTL